MLKYILPIGIYSFLCLLFACQPSAQQSSSENNSLDHIQDTISLDSVMSPSQTESRSIPEELPVPDTTELEHTLIRQGLVNMATVNAEVIQQMMYSTEDNFLNADVYGDFDACYLQPEVAERLSQAHNCVKKTDEKLSIIVFDCVRPRSVQYQMWEIVKGTDQQNYVAAPGGTGSMHNYGAAVDLGLWHLDTGLVDMGTPFDFFGKLAQPRYEDQYLKSGQLSAQQVKNRRILRACMIQAGFHGILSEWWHFVGFPSKEVRTKYQIVE